MDDDISGGLVEAGTVRRQSQSGFFFKNLASWTLKILCTHGTRGGRRGGGESMESRNLAECFQK